MFRYRISGLSVLSEIELPGVIAGEEDCGEPDVRVGFAAVPDSLDGSTLRGQTWEIFADRFLLRVPNIARFLITAGRQISVEPSAQTEPSDLATFLIGAAFGVLLHQRGQVVLHASAVAVSGRAVLFCGPSGAGKSTLAAALNKRGFPLVTDDFCAVNLDRSGTAVVHPDGRQMKLWATTIEELDLGTRRGDAIRSQLEKYFVEPAVAMSSSLPIGAIYILRRQRAPLKPGIEILRLVDAARQLERNAYRPMLIKPLGQHELYFRAAAAIANRGNISQLTRKLDFAMMPAVLDLLEAHWSQNGLSGAAA
jgi:hypothetical protein